MHFYGIRIHAFPWMPRYHAICLPEIGILVSAHSGSEDIHLLRHEFGHVLQHRQLGRLRFYLRVGLPSLWSAVRARFGKHRHAFHPVELDANLQSFLYFRSPPDWAHDRFPLPPGLRPLFYERETGGGV